MKCAACGYNGDSEEDFGSEIFLSTTVYVTEDDRTERIEGKAIRIFVCPKCGTLKLMIPEDKLSKRG
jgi:predicted RNA-binding Zn-ribbon protein involved in translation (DUF1610 family)